LLLPFGEEAQGRGVEREGVLDKTERKGAYEDKRMEAFSLNQEIILKILKNRITFNNK
jgi:hypothetical protein